MYLKEACRQGVQVWRATNSNNPTSWIAVVGAVAQKFKIDPVRVQNLDEMGGAPDKDAHGSSSRKKIVQRGIVLKHKPLCSKVRTLVRRFLPK